MNNRLLAVLLSTVIMHTYAQIAPLTELAAQKYSVNRSRIVQDLKDQKLNLDIQDIVKKQLIVKNLNYFCLPNTTFTYPFCIESVSFSPDSKYVLLVSCDQFFDDRDDSLENDGTVYLVNLDNFQSEPLALLNHEHSIESAKFSPDGKHILTYRYGKGVYIWDAINPKAVPIILHKDAEVLAADFSLDGQYVLVAVEKKAYLWNRANLYAEPLVLDHTNLLSDLTPVHIIEVLSGSPDGKHILTGSSGGLLYLWDITDPQCPPRLLGDDGHFGLLAAQLVGHHREITAIAFSPSGRYALTGSADNTACLWDLNHPQVPLRVVYHDDFMNLTANRPVITYNFREDLLTHSLAMSPCGRYALTGFYDKAYFGNLFDYDVSPLVLEHGALISSVALSPDGRYAITAGWDNSTDNESVLRLWDLTALNNYTLEEVIKKILAGNSMPVTM